MERKDTKSSHRSMLGKRRWCGSLEESIGQMESSPPQLYAAAKHAIVAGLRIFLGHGANLEPARTASERSESAVRNLPQLLYGIWRTDRSRLED
jgi:hypothetical protein